MKKLTLALAALFALSVFPSHRVEASPAAPLAGEAKKNWVLCTYTSHGRRHQVCYDVPLGEAQQKCNDHATKILKEPSRCDCTSDQSYIGDACG